MISNYKDSLRRATIHDALACALIVDEWVEKTAKMPRLYDRDQLFSMIKSEIPTREVWVIGEPIKGYIPTTQTYYRFQHCTLNSQVKGLEKYFLIE